MTAVGASGAVIATGAAQAITHEWARLFAGGGQVASGSAVKQWAYDGSANLLWTITAA